MTNLSTAFANAEGVLIYSNIVSAGSRTSGLSLKLPEQQFTIGIRTIGSGGTIDLTFKRRVVRKVIWQIRLLKWL